MYMKLIFESQEPITFNAMDGGMGLEIEDGLPCPIGPGAEADNAIGLIGIGSWNEAKDHTELRKLEGKRIRVTMEIIE